MVKKDLLQYLEFTDANLRRQMKLTEAKQAELDDDASDDLNGTSVWEDAFTRGTKHAFCSQRRAAEDDDSTEEDYEGDY